MPGESRGVLLARPAGLPTGRKIARELGLRRGTASFFRGNPRGGVAIRWGGTEIPEWDLPGCLNKAGAIRAASSKIASFRRFAAAGVPIPRFSVGHGEISALREAVGSEGVILGRTSQGYAGSGISVYHPDDVFRSHELYVEYIPNEREYRIHVVRGMVVSVQRKYLERPELRTSDYIKNLANGYVFKTPQRELNSSRRNAAVAAVESLGLDFGAVDLIVDDNGKEYVLEVNTAPALSPMRVQKYVEALRPLLNVRS